MNDPRYKEQIHKSALAKDSEYRLCLAHGALPTCVLTLSMTMRQAVMITMGLLCTELARLIYAGSKQNCGAISSRLVSMSTVTKFYHKKDSDNGNASNATYGGLMTLKCPVFSRQGAMGSNKKDLKNMEWLQTDDPHIPDHVRDTLAMIGDTRASVETIMDQNEMCYNRGVFTSDGRVLKFADIFAHEDWMVHAPVTIPVNIRVFSNPQKSYGSLKLCKRGCYYPVAVLSNKSIDTSQYLDRRNSDMEEVSYKSSVNTSELVARIKREVSRVLPRIDVSRIKMMAPDLDEQEFDELVSAVKENNIEVIGRRDKLSFSTSQSVLAESEDGGAGASYDRKRAAQANVLGVNSKKPKTEKGLRIFQEEDEDFGFDDSD